jgi:hypothetical protein
MSSNATTLDIAETTDHTLLIPHTTHTTHHMPHATLTNFHRTEGENYWARQGSWETGQKYRPVQRPPQTQQLKDEDSGSDSGFVADSRRKDKARRGSAGKDEKVRENGSGSALSGPKASVNDPDMDTDRY